MAAIEANNESPPWAAGASTPFATPPTLPAATYYFGCGGEASLIQSAHVTWDANLIGTATIEFSNKKNVSVSSTTAGDWIQSNPSTASVDVSGGTVTAATVTIPGGSAGGALFTFGNSGYRTARIKLVVGTQGVAHVYPFGKE